MFYMQSMIAILMKEQNRKLLEQVSQACDLPLDVLLAKYWTPSFYFPGMDQRHIYEIRDLGEDKPTS